MSEMANTEVAARLGEAARLLEEQGASPYRIAAYRRAADLVSRLPRPVAELVETEGVDGLDKLPGIGLGLAYAIRDLVLSGRLPLLERMRGELDPVSLLATIPGIGERTAERLHHDLGIDTLEELQVAAHDGWMENVLGIGDKRMEGIRDSLARRLGRPRGSGAPGIAPAPEEPPIAELLDVDREYREKAAAGVLYRITPRRENPYRKAWLPVLHTRRHDHHYTAMFSNTPRAHALRMTSDWVILYYDGGRGEHQCTVITARFGPLSGKRIVRGRESECASYYEQCNRERQVAAEGHPEG